MALALGIWIGVISFYLRSSSDKTEYIHEAINTSNTEPIKFLVVLITDKGQPIAKPVK